MKRNEIAYSYMVDTNPRNQKDFINWPTLDTIKSIHEKLGFPDSLYTKMLDTRALDGRQSDSYGDIAISWSYHPNNGLVIIYELSA